MHVGNGLKNNGRIHSEKFKTQKSIANTGAGNPFFGHHHTQKSKDKCGPPLSYFKGRTKHCSIINKNRDIFDGLLISDGSIDNQSAVCGRLTFGFKYLETIERLTEDLTCMEFLTPWKYVSKKDKRTGNYYTSFHCKSRNYAELKDEYDRWYSNGKKIVPKDITLTALFCYWWYVCDGYLSQSSRVHFATNCFTKDDLLFLQEKLLKIGFSVSILKGNKLAMKSESSRRFLNWIVENEIEVQNEYLYKWQIKIQKSA